LPEVPGHHRAEPVGAHFATLGRIRYAPPANDTANHPLLCEATDGTTTVSAIRTITITPVNDAPTIAAALAFTGGLRNTPFEITYDMMRSRSAVADIDSPTISFRIEAIRGGAVQKWDGVSWKPVSVAAAAPAPQRLLSPGQKIRWVPPAGVGGVQSAFTIRAWDGTAYSTTTATVSVRLDG
jgi:hypothetical protein